MDQASIKHPDRVVDREPKVLVGWMHKQMGQVIELKLQSVSSQFALDEDRVESQCMLLTHSQAAMLGKYLSDISGAAMPGRRSRWAALLRWRWRWGWSAGGGTSSESSRPTGWVERPSS